MHACAMHKQFHQNHKPFEPQLATVNHQLHSHNTKTFSSFVRIIH